MKTVVINLILLSQLAIYGLAYGGAEKEVSVKDNIEQVKPALPGDPFLQAEYLFHSGDFLGAKPLYHDYLSQNSSGQRSHQALYRLGLIDQSSHSYSTAVRFYQILLQSFPGSLLANPARFNMAICLYELADYSSAESMFKMVLRSTSDKKRKWEVMVHLALIDGARMDYEKAFTKLKQVHGQTGNKEIVKYAAEVAEGLINEKLGEAQVASLIQKLGPGFPVDLLLLRKISFLRAAGDIASYMTSLKNFIENFPTHARKAEMENRLNQIKADTGTRIKIGVILPLTGKLASTGQKVLQGIQLAVNQLPFQTREKLALEVRDSGHQLPMKSIIADLSGLPNLVGIIGPLLSDEVKIAGEVAMQYQIPIFSPTASTHGLVDENPFMFRNALTREIQAKFLAEYSVNTLQLKRFAVLHPFEAFGLELKDTFINEVESLGGEVVAVAGYERTQNDFKKQILELGGVEDDNLEKIARDLVLSEGVIPDFSDTSALSRPLIDMGHWSGNDVEKLKVSLELSYDAIFIPGVYDKVGLIIPQLAFYNINTVTLLGANGWNDPELVKMGGKYLNKVYFVDGYYPDSHQAEVKKFVQDFKTNFGEEPNYLSAQAFDAANIVIKNVLAGADNRIKMKESLKSVKDFPGVTGKTTLLPSGDSEKNIFALTVKRKKIVQQN
ncbi:MAG: penicillin-binding protein activator [Nitrospinae bacterium]|nr:penicillin-binding protein activator [Nitrospinota bacterium]MBL7019388.1 penicillin-binding protein activator [Nitrospinaceae bacterium]